MNDETEFAIPINLEYGEHSHAAIITNLYDDQGHDTWQPSRAMIALGVWITGPMAGHPIIIDENEIEMYQIKNWVH